MRVDRAVGRERYLETIFVGEGRSVGREGRLLETIVVGAVSVGDEFVEGKDRTN